MQELSERVRSWKNYRCQFFTTSHIPSWYIADLINDYVSLVNTDIIEKTIIVMHNSLSFKERDLTESDFRYASAIVTLAFLITGSRDVYEGIIYTLNHFDTFNYRRNIDDSVKFYV